MNYTEQLLSTEWKNKRLIILKRDNYCCTICNYDKTLQVHHKKYIYGRMAWDYPNTLLQTLCRKCHVNIHNNSIIKFEKDILKEKKIKIIVINKKNKKSKDRYFGMSNKDVLIQKKYDAYKLKQKNFIKNHINKL